MIFARRNIIFFQAQFLLHSVVQMTDIRYRSSAICRVSSHVEDFNARNKCLTTKLLKQGFRYHKLRKAVSKFYRRHYELISKFNVGSKSLLHQCLSEPEFYGD